MRGAQEIWGAVVGSGRLGVPRSREGKDLAQSHSELMTEVGTAKRLGPST